MTISWGGAARVLLGRKEFAISLLTRRTLDITWTYGWTPTHGCYDPLSFNDTSCTSVSAL